jgi:hypothetical protein
MSSFTKWATWTPDAEPEDAPASSTAPAAGASAGASSSSASSKALDARARVAALKARAAAAAAASAGAAPTASPPTDVFVRAAVATNQAPAAGAYAARLASDAEALRAEVGERDAARAAVRRLAAAVDDVLRGATATATAEGEPGASDGEASWARALASAEEEATQLAGGVERAAPKPAQSAHDDHHHHHHTHAHGHRAHNAQPCCEVAAVATAHAPTPASTAPPSWREEVAGDAAVLLRRCAYARAALLLARGRPELCVDACRSLLLRAPQASPFPWLIRGRAYASFGCPAGLLLAQLHVDRCLALAGLRADRVSDDFLHADVGVGDGEGEGEGKAHPSPGSAGASPTPSDPLLLPLDVEYGLRGGSSSAQLALGSAAAAEGDDTPAPSPSPLSSPSPSPSTTSLATLARLAGALAAPNTLRDDWACFVSGPLSNSPKASASAPASLTHLRGVKRGVMAALFAASMCSAAEIEGDELRRAAAGDAQPPSAGARALVSSSSSPTVVALSLAAQAALLLGEGMPGSARTRFAAALRRGVATPTADEGSVASCLDAAAAALPLDSSGTPSPSSSDPPLLLVTLLVASGGLSRSLLSLGRNSDDLALAGRSAGLALACLAALESRGLRLPALRAFLHLARGEVRRDSGGGDWEGAGSDFAAADAALREMDGGAKDGVGGCAGALVRACAEEEKGDEGDEAAPRRLAALALDGVWPGSVGEGVRGGGGGGSEPNLTATWLPTAAGIALARRKLAARRREAQAAAGKGKG